MKTFFLTFRSITQAQRAERAFARAGMAVILRRTPRWMEERGCGYGVEVKCPELRADWRCSGGRRSPFAKAICSMQMAWQRS